MLHLLLPSDRGQEERAHERHDGFKHLNHSLMPEAEERYASERHQPLPRARHLDIAISLGDSDGANT